MAVIFSKIDNKPIVIFGSGPGTGELTRVKEILSVKYKIIVVSEPELSLLSKLHSEKAILEIKKLIIKEPVFIEKTRKPHLDRNMQKFHRKSRW